MNLNITNVTTTILNLVLAFILGASLSVAAQPPFGGGGQRGPGGPMGAGIEGRFGRLLNLTDAQKTQIKALREQAETQLTPYLEQVKPIAEEMQKLVEAPAFDEATARALATKMAQVQVEIHIIRAKTDAAIYQLLTPEQKAKLAELRQAMEEGRGGPPNGGGEGRRGGPGRQGN